DEGGVDSFEIAVLDTVDGHELSSNLIITVELQDGMMEPAMAFASSGEFDDLFRDDGGGDIALPDSSGDPEGGNEGNIEDDEPELEVASEPVDQLDYLVTPEDELSEGGSVS